jgi:hypothetical protein
MADEESKQAETINAPAHDRFAVLERMTPPLRRTHIFTLPNNSKFPRASSQKLRARRRVDCREAIVNSDRVR